MSLPVHDPIPAPYRVAAIQFEPKMFAKEANIETLLALCDEAAANGARLIVTPEMATTGYCWASRAEVAPEVEPIPGPTTDRFAALAARRGCWIVVSLPEVAPATGVYYNSAVLIGPHGIEGLYRKTHSYISEPKWAKDGDLGLPVFDTPLGRIAMTICMDASFPETTRIPAVNGADVICFPTNWLSEKAPSPTWMARALESGVWFISANRWGAERGVQFDGGSCVIAPDGTVQSSLDVGDGIVYGEVDIARGRDKRPRPGRSDDLLADRRPELYGNLTLNAYLWNAREFHGLDDLRPLPDGRRSRVAVAQFAPAAGDIAANLARIDAALAESGAELLVAPELAISGQVRDRDEAARLAEPMDGPIVARLREIAARRGAFVVAGLVERDGDRLFNTAALVGPDGLIGRYRKTHLADEDRAWATPGDEGLLTFDLPFGRIGILIGYDALFPEAARSLALDGADLIACPSLLNWPPVQPWDATAIPLPSYLDAGRTDDHFHLWRERGRENNTYIAFANGGAPWMGWSGVFGATPEDEPRQEAVVHGAAPGTATLTIDTTNLDARATTNPARAKDLVRMRMPIWYDPLQAPTDERTASLSGAREPVASGARPVGN